MPSSPDYSGRAVGDMRAAMQSLNCGRSTLYKLLKTDPAMAQPFMVAGKITFFMDEIEDYKASRPRRQYALNHGRAAV